MDNTTIITNIQSQHTHTHTYTHTHIPQNLRQPHHTHFTTVVSELHDQIGIAILMHFCLQVYLTACPRYHLYYTVGKEICAIGDLRLPLKN